MAYYNPEIPRDYLYYNVEIPKTSKYADYNVTKIITILNDPKEYELAVVRFKIPSDSIPIFFFETNYWAVTITKNGIDHTSYLTFVQNSNTKSYGQDAIWTTNDFVKSVNNALKASYLSSGLVGQVPFIYYNPVSQLMTLYKGKTQVNDYDIYFNKNLFYKFLGFQNYYNNTDDLKTARIDVYDNGINNANIDGVDYLTLTDSYKSVFNWITVKRLILRSSSIPINPEVVGSSTSETSTIITDFEPIQDVYDRTPYYFDNRGATRYIDLNTKQELRTINIKIYWVDKDNKEYLLENGFFQDINITIKLLFRRKLKYQLSL